MKRKTHKSPTMNDVARAAGVTQATVSYVLNNTGEISEPVKKRVLDAADELGYILNIVARNLKLNKTNTIGIIVPDVMNSYYSEMIKFTEKITREHGYFTFICNTMHNPEVEDWYVTTLIQHKVAGVLVCYGMTNRTSMQKLRNYNVPFVVIDDELEPEFTESSCVLMNNIKGSYLAVQHLISLGITDIAYFSEPLYNLSLKHRYQGFKMAMEQLGLQMDENMIYITQDEADNDKIAQGYTATSEVLEKVRPRGIYASTDQMAFGVLKRLHELRIKVPEDIAVIGYDNVPFSSVISPSLTTINQPVLTMCIQGSGMLFNMIDGKDEPRKQIMLEPSIIIRESAP